MKWTIDGTHSAAEFAVRHLMISTVKGQFKTFTGSGETAADGTLKAVELTIDASSIDTNEAKRDAHLKSPDFFDTATFPTLQFRSTRITQRGADVDIAGELTIRGVTRPVTLAGEFTAPVKDPWGNQRAALAAGTKISRKEWGLTWNMGLETGGFVVSDDVKITVEVEAVSVEEQVAVAA